MTNKEYIPTEASEPTYLPQEEEVTETTDTEAEPELEETLANEEFKDAETVLVEEVSELPDTDALLTEISRLRTELEATQAMHARMADELGEFHALFPEVNTAVIPESIWEQVRRGVPLAASYALYEKKCALRREHAEAVNLQNAQKTPGSAGKNTPSEYFSPDEVRAMSQSEVHVNYQKILESMKKWNS